MIFSLNRENLGYLLHVKWSNESSLLLILSCEISYCNKKLRDISALQEYMKLIKLVLYCAANELVQSRKVN